MAEVLEKYKVGNGQYSMAISVPFVKKNGVVTTQLEKVFEADKPDTVLDSLNNGNNVYIGTYMIAARVIKKGDVPNKPDFNEHSEHRVLEARSSENNLYAMEKLTKARTTSRMVFYTFNSPCWDKCASSSGDYGILKRIGDLRNQWDAFYLVFSQAFLPSFYEGKDSEERKHERKTALDKLAEALGRTKDLGMGRIFRCSGQNVNCFCCENKIDECVERT